jgi:ABC-type transport system involved in multi-copper enzyme maturation permease subunit
MSDQPTDRTPKPGTTGMPDPSTGPETTTAIDELTAGEADRAVAASQADAATMTEDMARLGDISALAHPVDGSGPARRPRFVALRRTGGGIGAVGVKELRGRMRGRRAFVILTIYLVLLGGFAWMVELILERTYSSGFGGSTGLATASIGQGIFAALLMLETLQVAFLAPAATAGAISLEREKQTLELLIVTPISSIAIVLGKLVSALVYVWLLIAASIPLTAVVFVYGGVAPDDVLRGYLVLVVTALGFGAFGLLASSLVKRTQAATAISVFGVLFVSIGTIFILAFWQAMASSDSGRGVGLIKGGPPPVIAYLNPFLAQADVLCGTETSFGGWCSIESQLLQTPGVVTIDTGVPPEKGVPVPLPAPVLNGAGTLDIAPGVVNGGAVALTPADAAAIQQKLRFANGGVVGGGVADVAPVAPFGVARDTFWPMSVMTWLILSVVFLLLAVQFVSPTRRWHLRRRRRDRGAVV